MKTDEIQISVPWGHISAKLWGDVTDPLILVFHGIMDNAGSFDRLIPFLPTSFCYACFDLPGHGKSSHFPPYTPIFSITHIMVYKLIMNHFNREKYIIMGHSYGGQIAFIYAQLYPQSVEKLILLETVHLFPIMHHQFKDYLQDKMEFIININEKMKTNNRPSYTYNEALERLQTHRLNGSITREAAEALLPRSIEPVGDGRYVFTVDPRLKNFINPLHDFQYIIQTMKKFPITCPVLVVLGRDSRLQQIFMKPILNVFKKDRNVRIEHVNGDHDVHNNSPEVVSPHVTKFLLHKTAKL